MKETTLDALKNLSEKTEPMTATTVRFTKAIDKEIRSFCGNHPSVKRAVILRECLERGWKSLNEEGSQES